MPRSDRYKLIAALHRWTGLTVGAVFVVAGVTGTLLAYDAPITRVIHPELDRRLDPAWVERRATVLERIERTPGPAIGLVRFPTPALPAYEVYQVGGGRRYHDPLTGGVLLTRAERGDLMMIAHDLHIHLLAGERGERILGWLGIAIAVMLLIGVWLWWPSGRWRYMLRRPAAGSGATLLWWHKTIGAFTGVLLLFVAVTGFAIIFYPQTQSVFTTLFGGEPSTTPVSAEPSPTYWPAVIDTLDRTLPAGRLVFYYPGEILTFRKQMPGELHPNGRSFIRTTGDGGLLSAHDASRAAPGQRMTDSMYPLHSGRIGSETWRVVIAISGVLPALFFVSGFVVWWRSRYPARP